ncbi:lysophospholipid acyltransferase family protein [Desulfocurvus sp. DL9XJH121]
MRIPFPSSLASACLTALYRLLRPTLRIEVRGEDGLRAAAADGGLAVLACWHNELFCMPSLQWVLPGRRWVSIVSASADGEVLAGVLNRLDIATSRGSSSRQGVRALMGAVRIMKREGRLGFVTVDGPRGPRHQVKDGVLFLAAKAGAHLVPVRVSCSRKFVFQKAWDKFELPLPFSRCRVTFGAPYALGPGKLTHEALARERAILEEKLHGLG